MNSIGRFATRHPVWFAVAASVTWTALLLVLMGLASGALRRPYGDGVSSAIARLATTALVVALVWRLGRLRASGIGRLGGWPVWLLAIGGLVYGPSASLYSFYGRVALDPLALMRMPAARTTVLAVAVVALAEEVFFRGLVLHSFVRAWARYRSVVVAGVVLTALLFAALHATQILTRFDLLAPAAALPRPASGMIPPTRAAGQGRVSVLLGRSARLGFAGWAEGRNSWPGTRPRPYAWIAVVSVPDPEPEPEPVHCAAARLVSHRRQRVAVGRPSPSPAEPPGGPRSSCASGRTSAGQTMTRARTKSSAVGSLSR